MKKWAALAVAVAVLYGGHRAAVITAPHAAAVAHGSNEALANQMATSMYGWRGGQLTCLDDLWTEESAGTWSPAVTNPTSGATGIPQLLPSAHKIPANWSDPHVQIRWGLSYIHDRYGSPCEAWKHERSQSPNWY